MRAVASVLLGGALVVALDGCDLALKVMETVTDSKDAGIAPAPDPALVPELPPLQTADQGVDAAAPKKAPAPAVRKAAAPTTDRRERGQSDDGSEVLAHVHRDV